MTPVELEVARERYRKHLAANYAHESPYWDFDDSQKSIDMQLLARAACDVPSEEGLPPGPLTYMTGQYDDWGQVRDAKGQLVADTCPGMNWHEFSEAHPVFDDVRKAGPPEARAIANLLIWAERQVRGNAAREGQG